MAGQSGTPLENIVSLFRKESGVDSKKGTVVELEIRFQNVDLNHFISVYKALLANSSPTLSQTVTVLASHGGAARSGLAQRPTNMKVLHFKDGLKQGFEYVQKTPLVPPARFAGSSTSLGYIVSLSNEKPGPPISAESDSTIRVKSRASFELNTEDIKWRIDMTVVRQILGRDAACLQEIVREMFQPAQPANFIESLRLQETDRLDLYRYEIEVEFIGPSTERLRADDVNKAADLVLQHVNPLHVTDAMLQKYIYFAARYVLSEAPGLLPQFERRLGIKRLLPQALAITRADYRHVYPPKGFYLTEKADGRRALAVVRGWNGAIVSDSLMEFKAEPKSSGDSETVLDGELVETPEVKFYAFDVIALQGENLTKLGFEERLSRLAAGVEAARAAGVPAEAKEYHRIVGEKPEVLDREIRSVYEKKRPYEIDGLIFVEPGKPYSDTTTYKWKPPSHNTVDFLAKRAPSSILGREPYVDKPGHKLYLLFVGISTELFESLGLRRVLGYKDMFDDLPKGAPYFPVQFSPSGSPLAYLYQHRNGSDEIDGKVIECRCAGDCAGAGRGKAIEWEIVRVRTDRMGELKTGLYFGNDFRTAEMVWLNNLDPFPLEQLSTGPNDQYFMRSKDGSYSAMTGALSFVKSQLISSITGDWVVDIGAGKGQDLNRYKVGNLIAVDSDRAALSELIRRKYTFAARQRTARDKPKPMVVHVLVADVNAPHAQTRSSLGDIGLPSSGADALVCNLAVHYFLADVAAMRNFVNLARSVVKPGGRVVLTALDGLAVHKTLATVQEGESWDVFEGVGASPPVKKYSICRLYSGKSLELAGQRIGVLLPFSDGRYYEEFLVNTDALVDEFSRRGFTLKERKSVASSLAAFRESNRTVADLLTEGDRKWLALFGELVFERDNK